jgi:hypothetical protein
MREVEEREELVDGVVVREAHPLERVSAAPVAMQAAAVAGASFVAGATAIVLAKGLVRRRSRRGSIRIGGRRKGSRMDVLATRSFLVDVHLLDRR